MTYYELYKRAAGLLKDAGCPEPQSDAKELLYYVTGFDLSSYAARMNETVPSDVADRYLSLIERRSAREPVQYITGRAPFFGYTFRVTPDVLIPRFDTENLVEEALRYVRPSSRILDLCTGSGCIIHTILAEAREMYGEDYRIAGDASDISCEALKVAGDNGKRLRTDVNYILSDLFDNICETYDIITTNPPYIPSRVVKELDPEVRGHEPNLALDGKEDGLYFYRRISEEAGKYLKDGGHLILEIGYDQAADVMEMLRKAGFSDVQCRKDLAGCDRVITAIWQTEVRNPG